MRAALARVCVIAVLVSGCGFLRPVGPPGGASPAEFSDTSRWVSFSPSQAPKVRLTVPGTPRESSGAYVVGDGEFRRVTVVVGGGRGLLGRLAWTRSNVESACAFEAESFAWRIVDGYEVCVSTKLEMDKDIRVANFYQLPFTRSTSAFVAVDGELVVVTFSAPRARWNVDAPLREALLSSLRIAESLPIDG
jgi:hypothetical protein